MGNTESPSGRTKSIWTKKNKSNTDEQADGVYKSWFERSFIGIRWVPIRRKIQATRFGTLALLGLRLLLGLTLLFFGRAGVIYAFETWIHPVDYKLTAQQQAEGYDRTLSSGRSASPEDVYYRFYGYKDDVAGAIPCDAKYDWCVVALPAYKDCEEIFVEVLTYETDSQDAAVIETLKTHLSAPISGYFPLGKEQSLGVISKNNKSQFAAVNHIYCRGRTQ